MTDETSVMPAEAAESLAAPDHPDTHQAAPGLLPGEVRPHPSPFQYVMIAVILCVITGLEVGTYYLPKDFPRALYVTILLILAITKFSTVVAWYMHLRTDRPIFRRFFIVGATGAVVLYLAVLTSLHVFQ